jgi:hypothetical protein
VRGSRETAQDAEGQSLRIVHGAGRGMRGLIALVAACRKAIQSLRLPPPASELAKDPGPSAERKRLREGIGERSGRLKLAEVIVSNVRCGV